MILDLFCGAGGAGQGYYESGFLPVGVDICEQASYPFGFIRDDAIVYLERVIQTGAISEFAAVHASPPCQRWTDYGRRRGVERMDHPDLIARVRSLLRKTGLPYVIENVPGAPLHAPVRLCGSSFGLDVRRHRMFEANFDITVPPCNHGWQTPRFPGATNRKPNSRCTVEVGVWRIPLEIQQAAMGVNWMTREELSQAVPPAYTRHIGEQIPC